MPDPNGQTLLPAQDCVDALVAAGGNSRLAAERLGVPSHVLVASIAADATATDALNVQLRTLTTLNTYETMRMAKLALDASLTDMEPADLAKFYTSIVDQVNKLTDDRTTTANVNIHEYILRSLPPQAREALSLLLDPASAPAPRSLPSPADEDAA